MTHRLSRTAHWLCDSFADFIAPVSFVLLSYMDEMALNATRKNRARKEATLKELKVYARLFVEAKSAEIKSWFDNDVLDLVDIRKFNRRTLSQADGFLLLKGTEMASSRSARHAGASWISRPTKGCSADRQPYVNTTGLATFLPECCFQWVVYPPH